MFCGCCLWFLLLCGVAVVISYLYQNRSVDLKKFFNGKVVVLTGASAGIGSQLALILAKSGAKLFLVARREDRLKEAKKKCEDLGAEVQYIVADLSDEAQSKLVIDQCVQHYGKLDVLLLNAGRSALAKFEDLKDLKGYRELMDVNYWSNVALTHHGLPHIKKSKGIITVISSLAGKIGVPLRTGYSPTKFALHGFFNCLRCENQDIQVTIVCPGFVDTEIHHAAYVAGEEFGTKRDLTQFMTAEECATIILSSVARGERERVMTALANLGVYLQPFIPGILDIVAIRKNASAFEKKNN